MLMAAMRKHRTWTPAAIKRLRESLGLTQKEAAACLRVTQQLWADWERKHRTPVPPMALLLDLLADGKLPTNPDETIS